MSQKPGPKTNRGDSAMLERPGKKIDTSQILPLLEHSLRALSLEHGGSFILAHGASSQLVSGGCSPENGAILIRVENPGDPLFNHSVSDRKLMLLGAATGGIVHDINNVLGAVDCNIQLASMGNDNAPECLSKALSAVHLLGEMCKRVLRLSARKAEMMSEVIDVNLKEVVQDVISLSKHLISKSWLDKRVIQTTETVDEGLYCKAILPELQMAIINITLNAIRHGFCDRETGSITFTGRKTEGFVLLDVSNDGAPVPEGIREELLNKPLDRLCDNGFGLYAAAQGIRRFGGDLTFTSGEKKTTFTVWLPALG